MGGVESHDGIFAVAGGIVGIHHATAGEDVSHRIAVDDGRLVLPVDEVGGGGVTPVHIAPNGSIGVVLISKVVGAVLVDQSVGIVHPAVGRGVVVDRAIVVAVGGVEGIGKFHFFPAASSGRYPLYDDFGFVYALRKSDGYKIVGGIDGEAHVHICSVSQTEVALCGTFLNGNEEVVRGAVDAYDGQVAVASVELQTLGRGGGVADEGKQSGGK